MYWNHLRAQALFRGTKVLDLQTPLLSSFHYFTCITSRYGMAIQSFTHIFYPKFDCTHSCLHKIWHSLSNTFWIHAFLHLHIFIHIFLHSHIFIHTLLHLHSLLDTHFQVGDFFAHFPDTLIFKTLLQSQIIGRKIKRSEYLPSQVFNSWAPVWYSCHKGHVSGRIYVVNWREVWWFMIMIWILDYYKSGI